MWLKSWRPVQQMSSLPDTLALILCLKIWIFGLEDAERNLHLFTHPDNQSRKSLNGNQNSTCIYTFCFIIQYIYRNVIM